MGLTHAGTALNQVGESSICLWENSDGKILGEEVFQKLPSVIGEILYVGGSLNCSGYT